MRSVAIMAAMVGALSAPATLMAHEMRLPAGLQDNRASFAGVATMVVSNTYDEPVEIVVEVFDENMQPVPHDVWRSDWQEDRRVLRPGEEVELRVQHRWNARRHICTVSALPGFEGRVCARSVHVFGKDAP
jgi:hypothetical protein